MFIVFFPFLFSPGVQDNVVFFLFSPGVQDNVVFFLFSPGVQDNVVFAGRSEATSEPFPASPFQDDANVLMFGRLLMEVVS